MEALHNQSPDQSAPGVGEATGSSGLFVPYHHHIDLFPAWLAKPMSSPRPVARKLFHRKKVYGSLAQAGQRQVALYPTSFWGHIRYVGPI